VMLALRGIPATYVHSVVAGENDAAGLARTGEPRALHRRRFEDVAAFRRAVRDPGTRAGAAWDGLRRMLQARAATDAFHPDSPQAVLDTPSSVFAVERGGGRARVYVNLSGSPCPVAVDGTWAPLSGGAPVGARLELAPWASAWLRAV
jgi:hypothetical protein